MASKAVPLSLFERSRPYLFIALGLGSFATAKWQQTRKDKKVNYLTLMDDRLSADPTQCPTKLTMDQINNEYKFKNVSIEGIIDSNQSIIISPRKPPYSAKIKNININDPKQLGGYIYSPVITESGDMVIVNQGWIPKEQIPSDEDAKISENVGNNNAKNAMSVAFEGLITPLQNIPKFVKDAADFSVDDNIWPFMDNELLEERFGKKTDSDAYIVVDALKPENEAGSYPHRVQKNDLLMVNIPPVQHSVYSWMFCCTGIACFYYSYHFFKHPRGIKKMNALLQKQRIASLNTPRQKIDKKSL